MVCKPRLALLAPLGENIRGQGIRKAECDKDDGPIQPPVRQIVFCGGDGVETRCEMQGGRGHRFGKFDRRRDGGFPMARRESRRWESRRWESRHPGGGTSRRTSRRRDGGFPSICGRRTGCRNPVALEPAAATKPYGVLAFVFHHASVLQNRPSRRLVGTGAANQDPWFLHGDPKPFRTSIRECRKRGRQIRPRQPCIPAACRGSRG